MIKKYKIYFGLLILGIIIQIINAFLYPLVSSDGSYYLAMARDFYNGNSYFTGIATIYTPLSHWIFGTPFLWSSHPDPRFPLLINFGALLFTTYIFFKLLKKIEVPQNTACFLSLFLLLFNLIFDGTHLLLEPLSVLFLLLALYFYLDSYHHLKMVSIGMLIGLSFLSKQYGLLMLAPLTFDIIYKKTGVFNRILLLYIGFGFPVLLFGLYLINNGASVTNVFQYILGKGVALDRGNGTGFSKDLFSYIAGLGLFGLLSNYLFIAQFKVKSAVHKIRLNPLYFLVFGCSLTVLFNACYGHYFQYIIPFSILFWVYLKKNDNSTFLYHQKNQFLISIILCVGIGSYSLTKKTNKFSIQEEEKKELLQQIPSQSKVYFDGISPSYYYLCDYKSINLRKVGFTFPGYFFPKSILNLAETGSYLVIHPDQFRYYKSEINNRSVEVSKITISKQNYYLIHLIHV